MVFVFLNLEIFGVRLRRVFGKVCGLMVLRSGLLRYRKNWVIILVVIVFFGFCMRICFVSISILIGFVCFVRKIGVVVRDGLVLRCCGSFSIMKSFILS